MLSTLILSKHSYPAMHLAIQPEHHWLVHFGPLVLEAAPLKYPTPTTDRDQTVSRRFEPSSRTALIGEQPNPWDLLQPQDVMSRHRIKFHCFQWLRLYLHLVSDFRLRKTIICFFMTRVGVLI